MPFKCKEYTSNNYTNGYPLRYSYLSKRNLYAHRVLWEEKYGSIPTNKVIMHKCDNRKCIKISHLKIGTQKENIIDMHKKGRWCNRKGELHPLSKISNKQVETIRKLYKNGMLQNLIAKRFNVIQSTISRLVNHKRRNYV